MKRLSLLLLFVLPLAACAQRSAPPLPGDSVANDGAVSLASPRLVTNATNAPAAPTSREPLSAIEVRLFPADLVMEHQADIALTHARRQ